MTTRNILWMILLTLSLPALPADSGEFSTDVSVDTAKPIGAVNTLILGSNLQWVDRGDEMFEPGGMRIAPAMLEHAQALGVTLLRYPGGSLSDLYHWRDGMGGQEKRGENEHFYSGRKQKVEVGTQEFLELCESLGALPLITVNVGSGTAEEAAEWVRMVNVTGLTSRLSGKRLPRVRYWEIGNEPYLKDDKQKKIWMTPETYAARAAEFIVAMRKVDPAIEVGIPLRSDKIGGRPATPLPGFNETVLMSLKPRFDFVALHDAYLPTATDGKYSDEDLYWASVAATEVVQADFSGDARPAGSPSTRPADSPGGDRTQRHVHQRKGFRRVHRLTCGRSLRGRLAALVCIHPECRVCQFLVAERKLVFWQHRPRFHSTLQLSGSAGLSSSAQRHSSRRLRQDLRGKYSHGGLRSRDARRTPGQGTRDTG